jgi:hypothetical protein
VFGATLIADRPLPGLPVAPLESDGQSRIWTLRTVTVETTPVGHSSGSVRAGRLVWPNAVEVSLSAGRHGHEICITDTGRFTLAADDDTILHHAPPTCDRAAVALDLIGVVLPFALHRRGAWCVHASAVTVGSRVIAFVHARHGLRTRWLRVGGG